MLFFAPSFIDVLELLESKKKLDVAPTRRKLLSMFKNKMMHKA
jgi:hypothetical protein